MSNRRFAPVVNSNHLGSNFVGLIINAASTSRIPNKYWTAEEIIDDRRHATTDQRAKPQKITPARPSNEK